MLATRSPHEAYRRVDFDARVAGADPGQLVTLCYEQLISALGSAVYANGRGDNLLKSQSLTRALSAITALQLGVSGEDGMASALRQLYEAARRSILDSALAFDEKALSTIRQDFIEIARAMQAAAA
ncbi:MAG: flagellar protein FliS [Novosphingobium sp.]|jgi:flagellin-specific chaperone FliS|nr:flagellar protein FliS [Novosphingobium sp.]